MTPTHSLLGARRHAAVKLKNHVSDDVASDRLSRLIERSRSQTRRRNAGRVGEAHEVMVERPARRGDLMLARTRQNFLVLVALPSSAVGEYHRVRLNGTTGSTFMGTVERPALAVL